MLLQGENLTIAENPEYPSEEHISSTCNDALQLYNFAESNFGQWSASKNGDAAHFTKSLKGQKLIPPEIYISLPTDGAYGVDISRTRRRMTDSGHDSFTVFTSLRPQLEPAAQPGIITVIGKYDKDIFTEYASSDVTQQSGPLSVEFLNSLTEDMQIILQSEGKDSVEHARPGRFARLVGRLASAS